MPAVKGGGRWQTAILGSLDGVPRQAREVITEVLGRPPTEAEYNAFHRAARGLIATGQLRGWLKPGQRRGVRLLVLRRVDAWVSDHDGGTSAEQGRPRDPLADLVNEAWAAFGTDCGYAVQIAEAAANLARLERRQPGMVNPRDGDLAHGGEGAPPQVRPRSRLLSRHLLRATGPNWWRAGR